MKKSTTMERLNEIMKKRNLRAIDIVNKCQPFCKKYNIKMGKNDISQYVNGKVIPSQTKLTILAKALNTNEVWLMGYDVPEKPDLSSKDFKMVNQSLPAIIQDELDNNYTNINELSIKTNIPVDELKGIIMGNDKLPNPLTLKKIAEEMNIDVEILFIEYGYIDSTFEFDYEENKSDNGIRFLLKEKDRENLCKILYNKWSKRNKNITINDIYSNLFNESKKNHYDNKKNKTIDNNNYAYTDSLDKLFNENKNKLTESDKNIIKAVINERLKK